MYLFLRMDRPMHKQTITSLEFVYALHTMLGDTKSTASGYQDNLMKVSVKTK